MPSFEQQEDIRFQAEVAAVKEWWKVSSISISLVLSLVRHLNEQRSL